MPSWEREAFSTTCYIIWMSNSNYHYYYCYFAQGTTEKESEWKREKERVESFNKGLALPVCGPHCRIKSGFHRSHSPSALTSHPPTQCQVLLYCVCVCVCVRERLTFCQAAVYCTSQNKNLDLYWSGEIHLSRYENLSFHLSLSFYTHTYFVMIKGPAGVFTTAYGQSF